MIRWRFNQRHDSGKITVVFKMGRAGIGAGSVLGAKDRSRTVTVGEDLLELRGRVGKTHV